MSGAAADESSPLSLVPQGSPVSLSMSWDDPSVTEGLLAEMEEKEEQLLHAAEFGQALLQRTEELQEENETIARVAEEHEYRARELQQSLNTLAEEAAKKEAELETARLSLSLREQQVEARMKKLEGTQDDKESIVAEIQEEAEAAKSEAAEEIARLKAQQAEILASEAQMREAREEEERQRLALQKKQREMDERLAQHEQQQAQRESTIRRAARQLEKERTEKQRLEEELALQRKESEERRDRENRELLLRSTAEFHQMRKQLAKPGQVFSPDGTPMSNVDVPDSPSLQDQVERQLSSERHRHELSEYAERTRELERKLAAASTAPPPSPDVDVGREPEPEPESGLGSVLDQAKACIRRGDEHMSSYETEAAVEQYDAGLELIGAKPTADEAARQRETTPLFDLVPQDGDDVPLFDAVPSQDGETPAATSPQVDGPSSSEVVSRDATSPAIAAVQAELEEKRSRAIELLRRKEDEFRVRMLLDKGRDRMRSQQYTSALEALREGLRCCSDQPDGIFREIREDLHTLEAQAVEACDEQKHRRREERQRLHEGTKSGWLQKKGDNFKNFKKRWFVLECSKSPGDVGRSRIEYFEHEGGDQKGVVELGGLGFDAVQASATDLLQFCVNTPDRSFELLASSFWEREHWVAAIHWAMDAERAREIYGDGTKYQEIRAKEEDMYVVLSVTTVQGEHAGKTYYEIRVRHRRRITSVIKRYSQSSEQTIGVVYRRDHSDFNELHTHLHKVSELYRSVLSGKVLSHNMGVTLDFLGAAAQGGGLEFPKKTWTDKGGNDEDIIAKRKEKLKVWLQRIVMIERLKDEQKLLEFIGATPSRETVVTPRRDRDAPPWESDKEFELIDATTELAGFVQRLVLADHARSEEDADIGEDACMDNLVVTRVFRVQNKVLWEDFRRRQETIRQRSMLEGTPQVAELPGLQSRLHSTRGDAAGGGGSTGEYAAKLFSRVIDGSDVNEIRLWHGSTAEAAEMLVQYGFGHSDLDGQYGAGDYFSDCSSTAQEHSRAIVAITAATADAGLGSAEASSEESHSEKDGSHTIMLCRVTCGAPYLTHTTHRGDRRPPPNMDNHNLPFDCILAEIGKADGGRQMHNEVVVFQGQQVYPELLIEYTINKDHAL